MLGSSPASNFESQRPGAAALGGRPTQELPAHTQELPAHPQPGLVSCRSCLCLPADLANTRGDYITLRIGGGTGSTVVSAVERSGRLRPNFVDALVRAMRVRAGAGRGDAGPHAAGRAAALAAIRAAVAKALRGFESTVAEDRALVATGTLPFWKLGTTLFRIRHKMTLGSLLDRLDGDEAGMFVADGVTDNMDAAWWPENVPLQERRESTLFEVTVPAVV